MLISEGKITNRKGLLRSCGNYEGSHSSFIVVVVEVVVIVVIWVLKVWQWYDSCSLKLANIVTEVTEKVVTAPEVVVRMKQ